MPDETSFTGSELLMMYFVLKNHVADNNDMLDSGDYDGLTRDQLIDNNKLANSTLRKLRKMLVSNGVNPDDLIAQA